MKTHTKTWGVLIGRFQPFHKGHLHLIEEALQLCDALIIAIGSSFRARNVKNPWIFEERQALIAAHFPDAPLYFAAIPDFFYSETAWVNAVKNGINSITQDASAKVILFGHNKDVSTYYLKEFPEWTIHEQANFEGINATKIREDYFWHQHISEDVTTLSHDFLSAFQKTEEYIRLREEALFVRDYKKSWSQSPYPPTFVTTDAVVTCQKHILLIKRKFCPGKGLYALPGGFLEVNEWILQGLVRELKEETAISLSESELLASLKQLRVFDYPDRSLIGRVITHCGHFELSSECPAIKAADDALSAEWTPLSLLQNIRDQFHDDHYQIITTLLEDNTVRGV